MQTNHLRWMIRLLGLGAGILIFVACGSADITTLDNLPSTTPTLAEGGADNTEADGGASNTEAAAASSTDADSTGADGGASNTGAAASNTGGTNTGAASQTDSTSTLTTSSPSTAGSTTASGSGTAATTQSSTSQSSTTTSATNPAASTQPSTVTNTVSDSTNTVADSIVYVETSECGWTQTGTGVIVGDGLVLTASHIVAEADTIRVHVGGTSYEAWDQGQDYDSDLALLRTVEPIPGKPLEFGPAASVGDEAVLLQYTSANDLTVTPTSIVDVARDDPRVNAVIFFDTIAKASDSGGPVVNSDGKIIGIINRSRPYDDVVDHAIDGPTASQHVQENSHWESQPPITECEELPLSEHEKVQVRADHRRVHQLEWTFDAYVSNINGGYTEEAWDRFSPSLQDSIGGFDTFAEGTDTSHIGKFVITSIDETLTGFTVGATFMTTQDASDGPNGWTCARWTMQYGIIEDSDSQFLIDSAQNLTGSPAPCE